jgi:hypothetical protein
MGKPKHQRKPHAGDVEPASRKRTAKIQPRHHRDETNGSQAEGRARVSDDKEIDRATGSLSVGDLGLFKEIQEMLSAHLGSAAAARLWLVTPSPGFETTPLAAICKGQASLVLAMLKSQWGASPIYA